MKRRSVALAVFILSAMTSGAALAAPDAAEQAVLEEGDMAVFRPQAGLGFELEGIIRASAFR